MEEALSATPSTTVKVMSSRAARVLAVLGTATLAGGASAGVADAAYPSGGGGLVSDGVSRFAVFTESLDGVAVYDAATGKQVGASVPFPDSAALLGPNPTPGQGLDWNIIGLVDGKVFLTSRYYGRAERLTLAVADPASGSGQTLCAAGGALKPRVPPECPATVPATQIGSRWIFAPREGTLARYRMLHGRFEIAAAGTVATRAFKRRVSNFRAMYQPVDLDSSAPGLDRRWGYRRSVASITADHDTNEPNATASRVRLGKTHDKRLGQIDIRQRAPAAGEPTTFYDVEFEYRGMCASTGGQLVLWDRRTRRIWRRALPVPTAPSPGFSKVVCTKHNVLLGSRSKLNSPAIPGEPSRLLGPAMRWPTASRPAGWTTGPLLRPGGHRTYR